MSIIYPSTKVFPYVYLLEHTQTKEFYIGFRCGNDKPSSDDLGKMYFTSSRIVKPIFKEFNIIILAEFFDKNSAYHFEQELIRENFNNPLILNIRYQRKDSTFAYNHRIASGPYTRVDICSNCKLWFNSSIRNLTCSDKCLKELRQAQGKKNSWALLTKESRKKSNDKKRGKIVIWSDERKKNFHDKLSGENNPAKRIEVRQKISSKRKGKSLPPQSEDLKIKRSHIAKEMSFGVWMKGKKWYNNDIEEIQLSSGSFPPDDWKRGRLPITCNKCGYSRPSGSFSRYHNNDCSINIPKNKKRLVP